MKLHYFPSPAETNTLSTEKLRDYFLIGGLFQPGQVTAHYTDLDRMITGAALPTTAPLSLPGAKETGTSFFLERRADARGSHNKPEVNFHDVPSFVPKSA